MNTTVVLSMTDSTNIYYTGPRPLSPGGMMRGTAWQRRCDSIYIQFDQDRELTFTIKAGEKEVTIRHRGAYTIYEE